MSRRMRFDWPRENEIRCRDLNSEHLQGQPVQSRQEGIYGFDQTIFSKRCVVLVGAGGINGEIGEGLVRKGIGSLEVFDGDSVDPSNLNRQFFQFEDIGRNKAERLARNLQRLGFLGTCLTAHPFYFQEFMERGGYLRHGLLVCGVDNNPTRVYVSKLAKTLRLQAVFAAVSRDANQGYIFIQEADGPCFGCAFPEAINDNEYPCPGTPAIKDILKVIGGIALYAIDTALMERKRNWNYRLIQLAGFMDDVKRALTINPDCGLCANIRPNKDQRL